LSVPLDLLVIYVFKKENDMNSTLDGFRNEFEKCTDESELDLLCLQWLVALTIDNGREGEIAKKLLDIVEDLLSI
jgi:hypothetical protein